MAYKSGYRRQRAAGRVARPNQRKGFCRDCNEEIPAGGGQLWANGDGSWAVVHAELSQASMHPKLVTGGCPLDTDRRNAEAHAAGIAPECEPEAARIARRAANNASLGQSPAMRRGGKYAYTNTGARVTMSSRRCEDAPCCGCCD